MYVAPEVKVLYTLANVAVTSNAAGNTTAAPSDDLPVEEWC